MKNIKKIFLLMVLLLSSISVFAYGNEEEAFHYDRIHMDIKIKEKGIIEVTETRDTVFKQSRRGIFFNLSENYRLSADGNVITRKFNIYDVKVLSGHSNKITRNSSTVNIRLGNPDYYANTNEKYVVTYKILTKDLGLNKELFYYNLIGNEATYTNKLTFKITSYKDTDFSKMKFYKGSGNTTEFTNLKTTITNNSIEGEVLEPFKSGEPFTVINNFEKGYYAYPTSKSITISILFIVLGIIIVVIIFVIHTAKGKDDEIIEQITMKIPDGLNSADVAYLFENMTTRKAVMSLLFQLANENFIKIDAEKNKFLITKLKNYDGEDKAKRRVMTMIFYDNKTEVDLTKSSTRLGKELFYGFSAVATITENKFKKEKAIYNHNSSLLVLFGIIISLMQILYLMFSSYSVSNKLFMGSNWSIFLIIFIYNISLVSILEKSYVKLKNNSNIVRGIIFTILISGFGYLYIIPYMELDVLTISFVDVVFTTVCVLATIIVPFLGKRTEYGNKMLGQVKGLYTFIKYTKEDKIKMFLDENPNLFFDILPVAFAFGLTKKWLDLFKDMNIESMDNSYMYTYATINYLSDFNNNIDSIMPSYTEYRSEVYSSSSGSSGSGGGYSGSGGGGFGGSSSSGSW